MASKKLFIMGLSYKGRLDEEGSIFSVITDLSTVSFSKLRHAINIIGLEKKLTLVDRNNCDNKEENYDELFTENDFLQIMEHISEDAYYMDETTGNKIFWPMVPTFRLMKMPIFIENIPDELDEMRTFLCSSVK